MYLHGFTLLVIVEEHINQTVNIKPTILGHVTSGVQCVKPCVTVVGRFLLRRLGGAAE